MCVICLLSVVGCGQTKADTNTPSAANQQTVTDDYLTTISGTYVELFPELSKADYRSIWHDATAPLVGEDNADAATDKLLGMCTAKIYGADAAEKYAADPDSMAFDCYFLGGVSKFVMDGHKITGLDTQGKKVFSHTYRKLDKENENGFIFYQSEDENSGEFTYFAFSPDTMATTYHLEFRYAALNNSTFDVKRNDIIQMDKKGQYIPFCTKMVFLKYYTPSAENQLHFWGQADRIAYIKAINDVLSDYIEPIVLEKEETK